MQRNHVFAYLLFSLFLVLALSCSASSSEELSMLASHGRYEELAKRTETVLSKSIDAEPLYFRSVALQGLERREDAYHVLKLYFALAKEGDHHSESAHRLMTVLALENNQPNQSIASARWLEERALLQEAEGRAYYQSLRKIGQQAKATEVFSRYLRGTIDAYTYAQMLLLSSTDAQEIAQAFSILTQQEQLALLQKVASDRVPSDRALLLLSLATPLEEAFDGPKLLEVYHLLETLYGYADIRVQRRKYNSLITNF